MRFLRSIGLVAALIACFMLSGGRQTAVLAQEEPPTIAQQAQALFDAMSIAERVGQVFLVTFEGDQAPLNSDIADLILNYHVGGALLLAANDNITGFGNPDDAPEQVVALINDLQRINLLGISAADQFTLPESLPLEEGG
jgi:beta-N-acetylhexosaminidase